MKKNIKQLIKRANNGDQEAFDVLAQLAINTPEIISELMSSTSYQDIFHEAARVFIVEEMLNEDEIPKEGVKIEFREKDGFEYPYIEGAEISTVEINGIAITDLTHQWLSVACQIHGFIALRMESLQVTSVSLLARKKASEIFDYLCKTV